jgi:hypothetical protein
MRALAGLRKGLGLRDMYSPDPSIGSLLLWDLGRRAYSLFPPLWAPFLDYGRNFLRKEGYNHVHVP